jgi:hypothetical protein
MTKSKKEVLCALFSTKNKQLSKKAAWQFSVKIVEEIFSLQNNFTVCLKPIRKTKDIISKLKKEKGADKVFGVLPYRDKTRVVDVAVLDLIYESRINIVGAERILTDNQNRICDFLIVAAKKPALAPYKDSRHTTLVAITKQGGVTEKIRSLHKNSQEIKLIKTKSGAKSKPDVFYLEIGVHYSQQVFKSYMKLLKSTFDSSNPAVISILGSHETLK